MQLSADLPGPQHVVESLGTYVAVIELPNGKRCRAMSRRRAQRFCLSGTAVPKLNRSSVMSAEVADSSDSDGTALCAERDLSISHMFQCG